MGLSQRSHEIDAVQHEGGPGHGMEIPDFEGGSVNGFAPLGEAMFARRPEAEFDLDWFRLWTCVAKYPSQSVHFPILIVRKSTQLAR